MPMMPDAPENNQAAIEEYLAQENNLFSLEVFHTEVWICDGEYYYNSEDLPSEDDRNDELEFLGFQYVAQYHLPGCLDTHGTVTAETYDQAIKELNEYTESFIFQ
jgi:hypothetical protein